MYPTLATACLIFRLTTARYTLQDDYLTGDFASKFDFFTVSINGAQSEMQR
jgi:hypothetical protein